MDETKGKRFLNEIQELYEQKWFIGIADSTQSQKILSNQTNKYLLHLRISDKDGGRFVVSYKLPNGKPSYTTIDGESIFEKNICQFVTDAAAHYKIELYDKTQLLNRKS
eukprot:TRINITY_DN949_c0_g3_i6.p1 TRINITY_DN949_c0_g3~~TRINITY_DN949_c0_g3_i6.p1  ORF type:complete len:122 (-),score=12.61 TRINITY_DN949_c0_g3_i6:79-405(-)